MQKQNNKNFEYLQLIGKPFWTASLLPALIGTTLPFWLNPPNFRFRFVEALLFLVVTFLGHFGFCLLYFGFTKKTSLKLIRRPFFILGIFSLIISVLIGLYLNSSLQLHSNVPKYIFIIYGITAIFTGILYVAPPFSFYKRLYGEIVISVGLGMLPVLGAYLIQVGDITRTIYLASLPVVVSTSLWVWITELIRYPDDKIQKNKTTVMYFNHRFSSRFITLILIILIYSSLVLSVLSRSSLNPISLTALFSIIYGIKIVKSIWKAYESEKALRRIRTYAFLIHLSICVIIILASLSSDF